MRLTMRSDCGVEAAIHLDGLRRGESKLVRAEGQDCPAEVLPRTTHAAQGEVPHEGGPYLRILVEEHLGGLGGGRGLDRVNRNSERAPLARERFSEAFDSALEDRK